MNNLNGIHCYPDTNRSALVIRYKKPFVDWLVYISKEYDGFLPAEVERGRGFGWWSEVDHETGQSYEFD